MTKLEAFRRGIGFLEANGLANLQDLEIYCYSDQLRFTVWARNLKEDEFRRIKQLFGPMKAEGSYDSKALTGVVKLDDSYTVKMTVNRVYVCQDLDPAAVTEEKWADIRDKFNSGVIKIQDCTLVDTAKTED